MVLSLVAGCGGEGTLEFTASLDDRPLAGLEIVALPYDASGLLDSLEQAAAVPRPVFSELETELLAYRRKDTDSVTALSSEWAETRQAVADLADSLLAMERGTAAYTRAYARFRTAYDALGRKEAVLEGRMRRELGSDRELALRAGAAADSLRRWEAEPISAFWSLVAEYDEFPPITTDSLGRAQVYLEAGTWWLVARHPDRGNPFMEFAWHVPVVVSSIVPVATHLSNHNVTLRWRR
ncbi:MAG: hypothetical protein ACE10G_08285 [Gemmatimonadales bacterium]